MALPGPAGGGVHAAHWVAVYGELAAFVRELLAVVEARIKHSGEPLIRHRPTAVLAREVG